MRLEPRYYYYLIISKFPETLAVMSAGIVGCEAMRAGIVGCEAMRRSSLLT